MIHLTGHTLLVGGNNIGKSTVCEALDLVLGPERLYRRPVVDEHDFHCGRYLDAEKNPIEIRIEAILTDLAPEAELKFHRHLRRWDATTGDFADQGEAGPQDGDGAQKIWALPVVFIGRYDKAEDDFIGNTFFDHPVEPLEDDEAAELALGAGRRLFGRDHKRLCGFVFLRTLRTGSRALSLQRGSLLDTVLRLGGTGFADMWQDTLDRLHGLTPPIGEVPQLKKIRADKLADYVARWQSPTKGIETLLVSETVPAVHRRFLDAAMARDDYPKHCGPYDPALDDAAATKLATAVLKARKGDAYGYTALFIRQCHNADELPKTIKTVLLAIDAAMKPPDPDPGDKDFGDLF